MRVVVTIGCSSFLLPKDTHVQTILKAFEKSIRVMMYCRSDKKVLVSDVEDATTPVELRVEYVPDSVPVEVWERPCKPQTPTQLLRLSPPPPRLLNAGS